MKMDDIARLAEVSKSAVSLALNNKPGISSETREKIIRIAEENGYHFKPKPSLPEKPVKTLLFLVLTNSGIVLENYYQQPFFRELIHFIEEHCRLKGYSLRFSAVDMSDLENNLQAVAEENKDNGVILLGTNLSRLQIEFIARQLPQLVVLDTCYDTLPVSFVQINNEMGAYQAGTYLYERGHRSIGYVASDVRIHNFDARKRGFRLALKDYGLIVDDSHLFHVAPTILSSQPEMKKQLEAYISSGKPMPTAIFCECDYIAISAVKTLTELGFRIPEDISVIGFDNISEARIITPELTTIHVDKDKIARVAVDLLISQLEEENDMKVKISIDTKFIERLSCAAPAVAVETQL
ncbi:LacI family DNA-binding transcriptional regulator [Paenibacillus luteus]|uniref:LacI family DNA-binding transcriptional regulator n=1 Tax=Paenibacillus luteus TaxID=2545753 RepID=UPI00158C473D|nr:LacI family DNA-binding transcriptional regulator [Paenibacillus luteus]